MALDKTGFPHLERLLRTCQGSSVPDKSGWELALGFMFSTGTGTAPVQWRLDTSLRHILPAFDSSKRTNKGGHGA